MRLSVFCAPAEDPTKVEGLNPRMASFIFVS